MNSKYLDPKNNHKIKSLDKTFNDIFSGIIDLYSQQGYKTHPCDEENSQGIIIIGDGFYTGCCYISKKGPFCNDPGSVHVGDTVFDTAEGRVYYPPILTLEGVLSRNSDGNRFKEFLFDPRRPNLNLVMISTGPNSNSQNVKYVTGITHDEGIFNLTSKHLQRFSKQFPEMQIDIKNQPYDNKIIDNFMLPYNALKSRFNSEEQLLSELEKCKPMLRGKWLRKCKIKIRPSNHKQYTFRHEEQLWD